MHLTNQVTPTKEEFEDFIKNYPSQTPLVMLNILKFKSQSGIGNESGEEAYNRYSENVKPLLDKVGAKPIWAGNVKKTLIGDYTSQPDRVLIVYYPSKEAFIKMSTSEAYFKIGNDRKIGLEYGGLIATESIGFSKR